MKRKHYLLIFLVLIGSDIFIGMYGHFAGATSDNLTIEEVKEYFDSSQTQKELLFVVAIAICVCVIVRYFIGA